MRFKVLLVKLNPGKEAVISIDYRRRFISLLKRIFGESFDEESVKPYTFAVYFGKQAKFEKDFIKVKEPIIFRFSTGDKKVAMAFYDGVVRLKKDFYLHDFSPKAKEGAFYKIERIEVEEEPLLGNIFKTLSPIVVERKTMSKEPKERYVVPEEPDFNEWLNENLRRRMSAILMRQPSFTRISLEPIAVEEVLLKHYGGYVRGFLGEFKLYVDNPEVLKFVYQYGLGVRTGQGFGYLEVIQNK
jgi:CRISPR-associated endoribonuclease Cas6